MKRVIRTAGFFATGCLFFMAVTNCVGDERLLRTRDGRVVTFKAMIDDIRSARVIFVGETHNSRRDHEFQLAVIKALKQAGVLPAIGLEMFRAESQNVLDQWVGGNLELKEFLKAYYDNWGSEWSLYSDIFLYSREQRIPMIGLNVPDNITRKVSREGFASLTGEELKKLPPGISCNVDERYMDFIRRAYGAHGERERSFVSFCEAQMVWDKAMAWSIAAFMKEHPERVIVVLAGAGHSWKRGIPEQLEDVSKGGLSVILPEVPGNLDKIGVLSQDADYILLQ